jgi:NTP pyrophosphatase (non-canonical NTP hydrolase)
MASFFPMDIPFKNRSLPLNLTCPLEVNITGEHVDLIEEEYMGNVSTAIRDALWNVPNVAKFLRGT